MVVNCQLVVRKIAKRNFRNSNINVAPAYYVPGVGSAARPFLTSLWNHGYHGGMALVPRETDGCYYCSVFVLALPIFHLVRNTWSLSYTPYLVRSWNIYVSTGVWKPFFVPMNLSGARFMCRWKRGCGARRRLTSRSIPLLSCSTLTILVVLCRAARSGSVLKKNLLDCYVCSSPTLLQGRWVYFNVH